MPYQDTSQQRQGLRSMIPESTLVTLDDATDKELQRNLKPVVRSGFCSL
jgi:hypothetical protein